MRIFRVIRADSFFLFNGGFLGSQFRFLAASVVKS